MDDIYDDLCTCMKGEYSIFSFIGPEKMSELCKYFQSRYVPSGKVLWEEGAQCDHAAFIISGRVEVMKQTEFEGKHVGSRSSAL